MLKKKKKKSLPDSLLLSELLSLMLNIRQSFWKAPCGLGAKQTVSAGMKYRGAILCLIWSEPSLSSLKSKLLLHGNLLKKKPKPYLWDKNHLSLSKQKKPQNITKLICCSLEQRFNLKNRQKRRRQSELQSRNQCKRRWSGGGKVSRRSRVRQSGAGQDGWAVNVFQQEKPSSRARRAVWSLQLSPAAAPPCSPPKKQPMGINLRGWLAADLKQSACLSLSPSLTPPHSLWNVPPAHPKLFLCPSFLSNEFHC